MTSGRGRPDPPLLARLIARQISADRGAVLLVVLLAFGVAGAGTATLRALDHAGTDSLRQAVTAVGAEGNGVVGVTTTVPLTASAADPTASYRTVLTELTAGPSAELGRFAAAPRWELTTGEMVLSGAPPRPGPGRHLLLRADSQWRNEVRITAGRWPTRAGGTAESGSTDIALSVDAGRLMALQPGDSMLIAGGGLPTLRVTVSGLFVPLDPQDPFWASSSTLLHPRLAETDRYGTYRTGIGFLPDAALAMLADVTSTSSFVSVNPGQVRLALRAPLKIDTLHPEDIVPLAAAVGRAQSVTVPVGDLSVGFSSTLVTGLDRYQARQAPVQALITVLLAALLSAAAAVLLLASRLLLERRRGALVLARARGASPSQVATGSALEGLLLGVPGATVGGLLMTLLPGRAGIPGALLILLVGLSPAVLLPAWAAPLLLADRTGAVLSLRASRRDLLLRRGRHAGEALLVGLAVAAVFAVHARGAAVRPASLAGSGGGQPGTGVDPLVAALPLLAAAAAGVLLVRAVAVPLAVATRRAARRTGLVGFLGLARAGRAGSVAMPALVALILAVAVGGLAAITRVSLDRAAIAAAEQALGAPLRIDGYGITAAEADRLRQVPGVRAVAALTTQPNCAVQEVSRVGPPLDPLPGTGVTVLGTDPAGWQNVQRGLPGAVALPAAMTSPGQSPAGSDQPLPVLVSADVGRPGDVLSLEVLQRGLQVRVVAAQDGHPPGTPTEQPWVLVSLDQLRARTGLLLTSQALLARATGVPAAADLLAAVPNGAQVDTPTSVARGLADWPLRQALNRGLPLGMVVGGVLSGLAVMLALLLGARSRRGFLAHLRAMGLSSRQGSALVAVEVLPVGLAALLAGLGTGVGLALLILPAADLRSLTGAVRPPPVQMPVGWLLLVVGLYTLVLLAGVLGTVLGQRAVSPAAAARGEGT